MDVSNDSHFSNNSGDFWKFVDSRLSSQGQLDDFCHQHGLHIIQKLASGGFGSVYLAQDSLDESQVVIKALDFNAHQTGIHTRFWTRNGQSFCEVFADVSQPLYEILEQRSVILDIADVVSFLVGTEYLLGDDETIRTSFDDSFETNQLYLEYIRYPELVEFLCKENYSYEIQRYLGERYIPGILDVLLLSILDVEKLKNMNLLELWNLSPGINCAWAWQKQDNVWEWTFGADVIFPLGWKLSLQDWLEQSSKIFADHGKSLLKKLLWDSPDESWKFSWLPEDLSTLSEGFKSQYVEVSKLWRFYSLRDIRQNWPDFFKIRLARQLSGLLALSSIFGDAKNEFQRLLAIKHEIICANAMQNSTDGINSVVLPCSLLHGNCVVIVSSFLLDWTDILPEEISYIEGNTSTAEEEQVTYMAFPVALTLLYDMCQNFLLCPWILGDLKPGNFKMTLSGEWKCIDYGGHFLANLLPESYESIVGSNDYACYPLFALLHMSNDVTNANMPFSRAIGPCASWFSMAKIVLRLLSGKLADTLRGVDLNRALLSDFQGYHESIFHQLVDKVLVQKDSGCHYSSFPLLDKNYSDLFNDISPEIVLRRFLFVIGLTLTGYCPLSLLDADIRQKIVVTYTQADVLDSTWDIVQDSGKLVITEHIQDSCHIDRMGLHPKYAMQLLQFFFPNIQRYFAKRCDTIRTRNMILTYLKQLGLVGVTSYFNPPQIRFFAQNLQKCLAIFQECSWLSDDLRSQIMTYVGQEQGEGYDVSTNTLSFVAAILQSILDCRSHFLIKHWSLASSSIPVAYIRLFALDRWARVQYAWDTKDQDLLYDCQQLGWIADISESSVSWLSMVWEQSTSPDRCSAILYCFLQGQKSLSDAWENAFVLYRTKIAQHPFYSNLSTQELATMCEGLQTIFVKDNQYSMWRDLVLLAKYSTLFPWADIAIQKLLLDILSTSLSSWYTYWHSSLHTIGYGSWTNIPKNYWQWKENIQVFCQQALEKREFANLIFEAPIGAVLDPFLGTKILYKIFVHIQVKFQGLKSYISQHFLMSTLQDDQLPLEYLYQKLKKLTRFIRNDLNLEYAIGQLQWDLDFFEKELGKWMAICEKTVQSLQELEYLCHRWSEYAHAQGWTLTTVRQVKNTASWSRDDAHPILAENNAELPHGFVMDQMIHRLNRYVGSFFPKDFCMSEQDYCGILQIMEKIYQHGFLLKQEHLPENKASAMLYQLLRQHTDQFRNIPFSLQDLKKISLASQVHTSPAVLRNQFLQTIPEEVQEPNFSRSVLLEFLQYQIDISRDPQQPPIRKKILVMQLQREYLELQKKYVQAQQQYPNQLLLIENLSLVRKDEEIHNLFQEAKEIWSYKLLLFCDYLKVSQSILDIEKQQTVWNWRRFLQNTTNTFLLAIYPELKTPELSEIYLTIFDLSPLPDLREIKDFMQKCYHFHLLPEHRESIQKILSSKSNRNIFAEAKQYLDIYCIPWAEEEVRRALQVSISDVSILEQFWEKYFAIRKQLPVDFRIKRESRFLEKIRQASPQNIPSILLLELWLTKFQTVIDTSLVLYFLEEFEQASEEVQGKILQALENLRQGSDLASFFHWLFYHHILEPSLQLLDQTSIFITKPSEQIVSQLVLKYPLQDIPVRIQAQIVKTIKEKLALGWLKPQIASYVISMIG